MFRPHLHAHHKHIFAPARVQTCEISHIRTSAANFFIWARHGLRGGVRCAFARVWSHVCGRTCAVAHVCGRTCAVARVVSHVCGRTCAVARVRSHVCSFILKSVCISLTGVRCAIPLLHTFWNKAARKKLLLVLIKNYSIIFYPVKEHSFLQ